MMMVTRVGTNFGDFYFPDGDAPVGVDDPLWTVLERHARAEFVAGRHLPKVSSYADFRDAVAAERETRAGETAGMGLR